MEAAAAAAGSRSKSWGETETQQRRQQEAGARVGGETKRQQRRQGLREKTEGAGRLLAHLGALQVPLPGLRPGAGEPPGVGGGELSEEDGAALGFVIAHRAARGTAHHPVGRGNAASVRSSGDRGIDRKPTRRPARTTWEQGAATR